jgi:hypothetical protein
VTEQLGTRLVEGEFMAIRTTMSKSVEKNVVNKKRSNVSGRLNRAARDVSTGQAADLTPGVVTELFNRKGTKASNKKQQAITENRRRRHAPNIGTATLSRNKR